MTMQKVEPVNSKINLQHYEKLIDLQICLWALHTKAHYIFSDGDKGRVLAMALSLKKELEGLKKIAGPALMLSLALMLGYLEGLISYVEKIDADNMPDVKTRSLPQVKPGIEV